MQVAYSNQPPNALSTIRSWKYRSTRL